MTFLGVGRSLSNLPRRWSRSIFTSTPISVITSLSFSFARSAFSSLFLVRSSGRPRTRKLDLTLWWVLGDLGGPVLLGMALICGSSRFSMTFVTTSSIRVSHFSTTLLTLSSIDFSIVRSRLSSLQFNFSLAWIVFRRWSLRLFSTQSSQKRATRAPSSLMPLIATFESPVQVGFKCIVVSHARQW